MTQNLVNPLKPGTVVKIRNSGYSRGWITEYLGPLGPKGARIYSVVVHKKPCLDIEVREDQLEVLDSELSRVSQVAPTVQIIVKEKMQIMEKDGTISVCFEEGRPKARCRELVTHCQPDITLREPGESDGR